MPSLDLGLIGNCRIASLIDAQGTMIWSCLPQLDSDPVFCNLLRTDEEAALPGYFGIDLADFVRSEQSYLTNTAILSTTLYDRHGGAIRITDCAPRYAYVGRMFAPMMLLRRVEPLAGSPRIRVRLHPARDYGREACPAAPGSNHISYNRNPAARLLLRLARCFRPNTAASHVTRSMVPRSVTADRRGKGFSEQTVASKMARPFRRWTKPTSANPSSTQPSAW